MALDRRRFLQLTAAGMDADYFASVKTSLPASSNAPTP
jgi:hypothetical protein